MPIGNAVKNTPNARLKKVGGKPRIKKPTAKHPKPNRAKAGFDLCAINLPICRFIRVTRMDLIERMIPVSTGVNDNPS